MAIKRIFEEDASNNEKVFKRMLEIKGISFIYEPFTHDIIKSLKGTLGLYKPTQYTPDFLITIPSIDKEGKKYDRKIIIETKGFMRARDALINKIADAYYTSRGYEYYCITQAGTIRDNTRNYYLYQTKGIPKRGQKTRTFWDYIGIKGMDFSAYQEAHKQVNWKKKEFK